MSDKISLVLLILRLEDGRLIVTGRKSNGQNPMSLSLQDRGEESKKVYAQQNIDLATSELMILAS